MADYLDFIKFYCLPSPFRKIQYGYIKKMKLPNELKKSPNELKNLGFTFFKKSFIIKIQLNIAARTYDALVKGCSRGIQDLRVLVNLDGSFIVKPTIKVKRLVFN